MTAVQSEQTLPEHIVDRLVYMTNDAYPNEICGFVMSSEDPQTGPYIVSCRNIHRNPTHYFEVDHEDLAAVYEDEERIIGMYHSHPNGPEGPSGADRKYAPESGIRYFIVTRTHVHEYNTESWEAVR